MVVMAALLLLVHPGVPWGVGHAGPEALPGSPEADFTDEACRSLEFGIAGASTLWSDDEVETFIAASGMSPHYVHGFVNLGDDLPSAGIVTTEALGHEVIVTLEPWILDTVSDRPLRRLAEGEFDEQIRSTADQFAALDAAPIVRFGHEMNGNWYPWGRTGNDPQDYVDAFRRTVALFDEQGVTNVRWLWTPNAAGAGGEPLADYFPGDDVVDLVGLDGYNGGSALPRMGGWLSPAELLEPTLIEIEALSDKPIIVAETASARSGGDRARWVEDLVAMLRRHPRVVGFVWFEAAKETDWRLIDDEPVLTSLINALDRCSDVS